MSNSRHTTRRALLAGVLPILVGIFFRRLPGLAVVVPARPDPAPEVAPSPRASVDDFDTAACYVYDGQGSLMSDYDRYSDLYCDPVIYAYDCSEAVG